MFSWSRVIQMAKIHLFDQLVNRIARCVDSPGGETSISGSNYFSGDGGNKFQIFRDPVPVDSPTLWWPAGGEAR